MSNLLLHRPHRGLRSSLHVCARHPRSIPSPIYNRINLDSNSVGVLRSSSNTRPSKKVTKCIKDVKRYLNVPSIAKDGLIVVRCNDALSPSTDLIIVPRPVLDGLVTALHIKLDHPSKHQLQLVMKCNLSLRHADSDRPSM